MKGYPLDLTGKKFSRLTVIKRSHVNKWRSVFWECICDCGKKSYPQAGGLMNGTLKSCGCYARELARKLGRKAKTHGFSKTSTYHSWVDMWQRCTNKKRRKYKFYGGRGISVCKRWNKFINFYRDMGVKPNGMTIDRIDNNKGYYPSNCRWANYATQASNRRSNKNITFNGKTRILSEWAKKFNLDYLFLWRSIYVKKIPLDKIFSTSNRDGRS